MARVDIVKPREQAAHFGLYRTSAGGDQGIIVRRKVGEPTDYMHTKSRKLRKQRDNLALASKHYAHLSPSQKGITRHQFAEVEYQKSHGKTDTKLLMGRQLFISKEMRSLETTQKQIVLPHELCIMLVDEGYSPLEGELWLRYLKNGEWLDIGKEELATGSWLFSQVPRGQEAYRPYGEAEDYFDPGLLELQFMTEDEIRAYPCHHLWLREPPYHLPYKRYRYITWSWYIAHMFIPTEPIRWVYVYSEITSHGFEGTLTTGIKEPFYPPPPPEWITSKQRTISLAPFETSYYFTTLNATALIPGHDYRIVLQLADDEQPYWWGYNDVWLIP